MKPAIQNGRCRLRHPSNCHACRSDENWRRSVRAPDACPHGYSADSLPMRGLGDLVERIAKPIAKALRLDCLEPTGTLKPSSPCAKRRDALNKITVR